MIDGLDGLRLLSPEEAKTFPEPSGKVELTLAGAPLPYDAEANAYLIPQSAETEGFDGAVELRREAGYTYYLCPSAAVGKAEALYQHVFLPDADVQILCNNVVGLHHAREQHL